MFHAAYCKVCQRAGVSYRKVAAEYRHDDDDGDRVADFCDWEASGAGGPVLRALGLTKFPFVQIFRAGDCVAAFSLGSSAVFPRRLRETVDLCLGRSPSEWDAFRTEFQREIADNRRARDELSEQVNSHRRCSRS
jgi:hypothetical protein